MRVKLYYWTDGIETKTVKQWHTWARKNGYVLQDTPDGRKEILNYRLKVVKTLEVDSKQGVIYANGIQNKIQDGQA